MASNSFEATDPATDVYEEAKAEHDDVAARRGYYGRTSEEILERLESISLRIDQLASDVHRLTSLVGHTNDLVCNEVRPVLDRVEPLLGAAESMASQPPSGMMGMLGQMMGLSPPPRKG